MENRKKYWIVRLFFVLFTVSVSAAVLSCGIINVHGLFGEIITSAVVEDKEQESVNIISIKYEKTKTAKGENIFNIWFEILITVVCIGFSVHWVKLPREDTIVILKVRMDC